MRRVRNIARYLQGLMLTMAVGMPCVAAPALVPTAPATAETAAGWTLTGALSTNRFGHTATLLTNGKVLVVGGGGFPCAGNFCFSTVNGSAELYDPATGVWSNAGQTSRRISHTATRLQNGQVLVAGGSNYGYDIGRSEYLTSADLYDPTTGSWRPTGGFNLIVAYHSVALLPNGQVLAVGSSNLSNHPIFYYAERYDPATGAWSITNAPNASNMGPLTVLPNGKVLLVAGNQAELYDPTTGQWSSAGNLSVIRFAGSATLLLGGKVLVIGDDGSGDAHKAELYDPATGAWSSTEAPSQGGSVTLLADGRVLIAGGVDTSYHAVSSAELYDPATGTWSLTSHLNIVRSGHTATLLPDGRVLVAGGVDGDFDIGTIYHHSAELYSPTLRPNPIDDAQFFVRQQYLDFLGREPDSTGLQNWTNTLTNCPNGGFGEFDNPQCDRVHVSAGFYLSDEFRGRGYWAYRFYQTSFGRAPLYTEFIPDMMQVGGPQSPQQEAVSKKTFTDAWVNRPEFKSRYDALGNTAFVDTLLQTAAVTSPDRDAWVNALNQNQKTRAQVLREIVESKAVEDKFLIEGFVSMQYFGYLKRDPDATGYHNWVQTLRADPGNYRHMIYGFIYSIEYRSRFGIP
jgi:N-acetylneuraminic acid mutarotase